VIHVSYSYTDLGHKATQLIADSDDPLTILKTLSQDFPKYAAPLARRVVVNESITQELHDNQLMLPAGANVFWLNGVSVPEKDVTPFGLLRMLKKERQSLLALESLGLDREQAMNLLTHIDIAKNQVDKDAFDGLVDASDRPEEGGVIMYWNDIEKDKR
jgi:UDP-glucose:glycoprotein glucosyltransferase